MHIEFVNLWLLYLLWLVPAAGTAWYLACKRREAKLAAFVSPAMQSRIRPGRDFKRLIWQSALLGAGVFLLLIAAARPRWGIRQETVYRRGRDLMIALDVSLSMLANDVHPNRLERAKADIVDLVKELKGDRAGLIAFRGKANLLCPLTTDYAFVLQALDGAGPSSAPSGETDIGSAIRSAMDAFESDATAHQAVILISDGEDLTATAREAAAAAAKRGVPIFTVGIGARAGARIPVADGGDYLQYQGSPVVTKLDHETLYAIAGATGGAYIPIETAGAGDVTLGTLYRDHLRKVDARDIEESLRRQRVERYQLFLLPGWLLLLAAAFLSRGRLAPAAAACVTPGTPTAEAPVLKDLNPPSRPLKSLSLWLTLAALPLTAAQAATNAPTPPIAEAASPQPAVSASDVRPGRVGARRAQQLYRDGKFEAAAEVYLRAATTAAARARPDYRYNAAVALFKAGQYKAAADLLRALTLEQEGDAAARAAMGLGAALYRQTETPADAEAPSAQQTAELLSEAGEAFKEALRTREQETAARNLAAVLQKLPQARDQAEVAALMRQYGQQPPDQLAQTMLQRQRALDTELQDTLQDRSPERVRKLEQLADRQRENAKLWIPLKGKLLGTLGQAAQDNDAAQQQLQQAEQHIERLRNTMLDAADALRDLDEQAVRRVRAARDGIYGLWKGVAPFDPLLQEDLRRQTNAIASAEALKTGSAAARAQLVGEQRECLQLSQLFQERFAAAVPETGAPPPPANEIPEAARTNAAPGQAGITAETRMQILDLSEQAIAAQKQAADQLADPATHDAAVTRQQVAAEALRKIRDLLPKQDQPQRNQDKPPSEQPEQQPQPQSQPQPDPQESETKPDANESEPELPRDVRELLRKALQREREHRAEKERRSRRIPVAPIERDW